LCYVRVFSPSFALVFLFWPPLRAVAQGPRFLFLFVALFTVRGFRLLRRRRLRSFASFFLVLIGVYFPSRGLVKSLLLFPSRSSSLSMGFRALFRKPGVHPSSGCWPHCCQRFILCDLFPLRGFGSLPSVNFRFGRPSCLSFVSLSFFFPLFFGKRVFKLRSPPNSPPSPFSTSDPKNKTTLASVALPLCCFPPLTFPIACRSIIP